MIRLYRSDIDLCDNLDLLTYVYKETKFFCSIRDNMCEGCPCYYNDEDNILACRKDHLLKRIMELSGVKGVSNE